MADSSPGLLKQAVVLLGNIPDSLSDPAVSEFTQEHGLTVERSQKLEKRKMLVTVSGMDEAFKTFITNAPYAIDADQEIFVEKHWETESLRNVALEIRGLPKGIGESIIKFYMEDKDENTEVESVSLDSEVATVKIVDPTAIPYWLCAEHHMKKQPIYFTKVTLLKEDKKKAFVCVSDFPETLTVEMVNIEFENQFSCISSLEREGNVFTIVFDEDGVAEQVADTTQTILGSPVKLELCYEPLATEAQVLVISGVPQMAAEAVQQIFGVMFKKSPYRLEIARFAFEDSSVFITFTNPTGVQKVMESPPKSFLGATVECEAVNESEIDVFPGSSPRVLMIRNLPLETLPMEVMQQSLEIMFKNVGGHEIGEMKVVDGNVYIQFSNPGAVRALIKNPPEGGTFLGSPVEYFSVLESQIPDNRPHVLVVTGFPPMPTVDVAMKHYLKTVVQKDIVSIVVLGEEALVKFSDSKDAKEIAANPPTSLFLGYTLQFSSRPEECGSSEQHSSSKECSTSAVDESSALHKFSLVESLPVFPVSEPPSSLKPRSMSVSSSETINVVTSPLHSLSIAKGEEEIDSSWTIERKHNSGSSNLHKSVVVKGLPKGVKDYVLILYMDNISPVKCDSVTIAGAMAVVEFQDCVDVKNLRKKALERPFPVNHVMVVVEALEPSCSLLVSDIPAGFEDGVIAMYFEKYCENCPEVTRKGEAKAVVTFEKHEDVQKMLKTKVIEIGLHRLLVSPHHPILAELEDPLPPPSPSPKPLEECLSKELKQFYEHILVKLNESLQTVHATAVVQMSKLIVQPQDEAAFLPNWEEQAREILSHFAQDFNTAEQSISDERKAVILDKLLRANEDFPDLTYVFLGKNTIKISGSSATVQSVIEILNNIVETKEEITLDTAFSPKDAEYIMKFAKQEIEEINPPIQLDRDSTIPGKTTIRGSKRSLDRLKAVADEKITQAYQVVIPLSVAAHQLLRSKRGILKMEECLGDASNLVLYGLEKLDRAAQLFIMAPNEYACRLARTKIEILLHEKKIALSSDKRAICSESTQEWCVLVEKVASDHFVAVHVEGDLIVIVGEESVVPQIAEQVEQFVMEQGAITATFELKAAEWKVIRDDKSISRKLKAVQEDCKKQHMRITYPQSDGESSLVSIKLHGDPLTVEGAKGRLYQLFREVHSRDMVIPPRPGLDQIARQMSLKCKELQDKHGVVIEQEFLESKTSSHSFMWQNSSGSNMQPMRLLTGMNEFGTKVSVYVGDYTKKGCDALVSFVTPMAAYDAPVIANLIREGGIKVKRGIEDIYKSNHREGTAITSCSGSLTCSQVILAKIPLYVGGKEREVDFLDSALQQILQGPTPSNSNTILITPFTSHPCNYPIDLCAQRLLQVISQSESQLGMYSDITIMIFVEDASHIAVFEEYMRQWEYNIITSMPRSATHSLVSHTMSPPQAVDPTQQKSLADSLSSVVRITKGSMLDVQADVYINTTNADLDLSKGELSQALLKVCGKELQEEAKDYAPLKPGYIAVTTARNSNAKSIYHVVLPSFSETGAQSRFRETVQIILRTAKQEGRSSIAIPFLGAANLGYPTSVSVKVLFDEVISFHAQNPTAIQTYHFVLYNDSDYEVFKQEYDQQVRKVVKVANSLITSSKKSSLKIILAKGDIAEEKSNVVVNSASVDMQPCNRISHAVHAAAGPQLKTICSSLVDTGVSLSGGKVVPTKATGKLKCSKLYHINMPGKKREVPPKVAEKLLLKKIVHNCLKLAKDEGQRSISLPNFCLGIGGYTVSESGELMLEAIREFSEMNSGKVEEIRVVILDDGLYAESYEFFCKYFKDDVPVTPKVTTSRFKLFKKLTKEEGVYVELQGRGVLRQHAISSLASAPLKPSHSCSIMFRMFSASEDRLSLVESELRGFINEYILEEFVDLEECECLLQQEDIDKLYNIAERHGVEIQIQQMLQRVLVRGEAASVHKACTEIQKIVLDLLKMMGYLKTYEQSAIDDNDSTSLRYPPQVSMLLESASHSEQMTLEVVIDGVTLETNLQNRCERDVKAGITRKIHQDRKIEHPDLTKEWSPQPQDQATFVDVDKFHSEFKDVTKSFSETMSGSFSKFTIIRVQRVQNPQEYYQYLGLKSTWQSTGRSMKETELFHRTGVYRVSAICSQGFNRSFTADANAAHFVRGVYFALRADYSAQDKYSAPDKDGEKHILVCTMLVGKYTKGSKTMKVAPALPNNPQDKDQEMKQLNQQIQDKDLQIREKDQGLQYSQQQIQEKDEQIQGKDQEIQEKKDQRLQYTQRQDDFTMADMDESELMKIAKKIGDFQSLAAYLNMTNDLERIQADYPHKTLYQGFCLLKQWYDNDGKRPELAQALIKLGRKKLACQVLTGVFIEKWKKSISRETANTESVSVQPTDQNSSPTVQAPTTTAQGSLHTTGADMDTSPTDGDLVRCSHCIQKDADLPFLAAVLNVPDDDFAGIQCRYKCPRGQALQLMRMWLENSRGLLSKCKLAEMLINAGLGKEAVDSLCRTNTQ